PAPMALLSLNDVTLRFAGPPLLDQVSLQIDDGERVGLLGRNGAGKSTLLNLLLGTLTPDSGDVVRRPGLRVAGLQQDVPLDLVGTVGQYLHAACGVTSHDSPWEVESRIDGAARDLKLNLESRIETLSAGSKRRVLLAEALVRNPDILVLDEPTNHLDIDVIRDLEESLLRRKGTLVFVTHDRSFLRRLATRILDLDRGNLSSYRVPYDQYLEMRDHAREIELQQDAQFDRKLAQEEAWLRQGIKARRTRNEGRVKSLEALRVERGDRREDPGRVKASLEAADSSGRIVLRTSDAGFGYDGRPIVSHLTLTIRRGDRIGILGPNGSGKTTLIRLLLGELEPQHGSVTPGARLEVGHFEQLHDVLDDSKTVLENLADGRDFLSIGGSERHVVGYLRDFLFTPEQMQGSILKLSGGERKRLQLAKVLSRPCNLLVLDEPTNDLDMETLELLEEILFEFAGTILVVSHDRAFLDNVVTSTLVWEGHGHWREFVGGYSDWLRQRPAPAPPPVIAKAVKVTTERHATTAPRRATFKEKKELEELPGRIEALEAEKQSIFDAMAAPDYHTRRGDEVTKLSTRLTTVEAELEKAYARWMELETIVAGGG
ncbi:MAG TPA: ATP-binding cassette domain-containing protein, partial [Candidatus Eisenbacteria bacterium]